MKAVQVVSDDFKKDFLNFPARLFQNDKNYIRPLNNDIEEVFSPKRNKFFRSGECERFLFKKMIKMKPSEKLPSSSTKNTNKSKQLVESAFSIVLMIKKQPILYLILPKIVFKKKAWKRWMDRLISGKEINFGDF